MGGAGPGGEDAGLASTGEPASEPRAVSRVGLPRTGRPVGLR